MTTQCNDRVYLGTVDGEKMFLSKHSWDCGWYWGFGYIGNRNLHIHFDTTFMKGRYLMANQITNCPYSDTTWYKVLDLFKQAYALRDAAAVYRIGGHISSDHSVKVLRSCDTARAREMADTLNADLEIVLDTVWNILINEIEPQ